MAKETYLSPAATVLGTVHELTLVPTFNKIGTKSDQYTAETGGAIVGSVVPL
jgi:hypothetical protein